MIPPMSDMIPEFLPESQISHHAFSKPAWGGAHPDGYATITTNNYPRHTFLLKKKITAPCNTLAASYKTLMSLCPYKPDELNEIH